jgi:hypothetical protein
LGDTGVMAMKTINNTKRMSIIGVTFISEERPPPLPVENDMRKPLSFQPCCQGRLF